MTSRGFYQVQEPKSFVHLLDQHHLKTFDCPEQVSSYLQVLMKMYQVDQSRGFDLVLETESFVHLLDQHHRKTFDCPGQVSSYLQVAQCCGFDLVLET